LVLLPPLVASTPNAACLTSDPLPLQGVLTPTEMALLLAANHRPMFVLAVLTELAEAAPLRDSQRNRIDEVCRQGGGLSIRQAGRQAAAADGTNPG
jgi:hypothetical protein